MRSLLTFVFVVSSLATTTLAPAQDPQAAPALGPNGSGEPQVFGSCGPICQVILLAGEHGSFLLHCEGTGKAQYSIDNYVCPDVTLENIPRRYPDGYVYYRDSTNKTWAIERRPCGYKRHKIWVQVRRHALDGGDNWEEFQIARLNGV